MLVLSESSAAARESASRTNRNYGGGGGGGKDRVKDKNEDDDNARTTKRGKRRSELTASSVAFLRSLGFIVRNRYGPGYSKYRR